jgi:hypothetical protein
VALVISVRQPPSVTDQYFRPFSAETAPKRAMSASTVPLNGKLPATATRTPSPFAVNPVQAGGVQLPSSALVHTWLLGGAPGAA